MNRRLLIAVVLGTVFLAIFIATTLVLSTLLVPDQRTDKPSMQGTASRDDPARSAIGLERTTDGRASGASGTTETAVSAQRTPQLRRDQPYPWSDDDGSGRGSRAPAFRQPAAPADWWQDPSMGQQAEPGARLMQQDAPWNYRFRPLDERERERLHRQRERRFDWTERPDRDPSDSAFGADGRRSDGYSSDWGGTPYRFRPPDQR